MLLRLLLLYVGRNEVGRIRLELRRLLLLRLLLRCECRLLLTLLLHLVDGRSLVELLRHGGLLLMKYGRRGHLARGSWRSTDSVAQLSLRLLHIGHLVRLELAQLLLLLDVLLLVHVLRLLLRHEVRLPTCLLLSLLLH